MCDFNNGIKFCLCSTKKIKFRSPDNWYKVKGDLIRKEPARNAKIPLEYLWTLYKFDGEKEVTEIGYYRIPVDDLGKRLNAEWIALNLNCEECFDFEYSPSEGDTLRIHQNVVDSPYLSFIFLQNEWVIGDHDPWSTDISQMMKGVVKAVD